MPTRPWRIEVRRSKTASASEGPWKQYGNSRFSSWQRAVKAAGCNPHIQAISKRYSVRVVGPDNQSFDVLGPDTRKPKPKKRRAGAKHLARVWAKLIAPGTRVRLSDSFKSEHRRGCGEHIDEFADSRGTVLGLTDYNNVPPGHRDYRANKLGPEVNVRWDEGLVYSYREEFLTRLALDTPVHTLDFAERRDRGNEPRTHYQQMLELFHEFGKAKVFTDRDIFRGANTVSIIGQEHGPSIDAEACTFFFDDQTGKFMHVEASEGEKPATDAFQIKRILDVAGIKYKAGGEEASINFKSLRINLLDIESDEPSTTDVDFNFSPSGKLVSITEA